MSTIHLDKLLNPNTLAVVGASDREGAPGHAIAQSLLSSEFHGSIWFINPRYKTVLGQPCLRSLAKLDQAPDLVVVIAPERVIEKTLSQAADLGCRVVLVMSAVRDSKAIHAFARKRGIRMLGPFCAGLIRPHINLNATYSSNRIEPGSLAIVTQSASLGAAIIDWADTTRVGFSAVLSTGSDTDISLPDVLDLLVEDHHTRGIIVYVDKVKHTRSFLSAVSAAARIKPVVLMKSTQEAARYCDANTRTGKVYSTEAVFQTAMRRAGVVRVRTFSNLFSAAKILTSGLRLKGKRLAIISNGAAPAMLACERIATKGFALPELPDSILEPLNKSLKGKLKGKNPLVLRDAENLSEQYRQALTALNNTDTLDGLLVLFAPDARNNSIDIADIIIENKPAHLPVLTSFMGEASVAAGREKFAEAQVPCFRTPEAATDAFDFLHRYLIGQQQLLQLPNPASRFTRADVISAKEIISSGLEQGTRVLGPQKSRELLGSFDINKLPAIRVLHLEDATKAATKLGYPLAMKVVSPNVRYKSEVIGTKLNIANEQALENAFSELKSSLKRTRPDAEFRGVLIEPMFIASNSRDLSVSLTRDATFGPVVSVGIGGDLSTLVHQRATQLPPLNTFLIESMLSSDPIASYLGDFRHQHSVGTKAAAHVLRRVSEMACELPELFSLNINPLRITPDEAVAMDVEIVLERSRTAKDYAHLAIHPYPWRWVQLAITKNGKVMQLRPIRPEDGESIKNMVSNMSAESRYFRFMHAINALSPQMVAQFTKLDYDRQMAFVAVSDSGSGEVVGVSRYAKSTDQRTGEFAVSVADQWQGQGLASSLMRLIIEHATTEGLDALVGDVLQSNNGMRKLMKSLGFVGVTDSNDKDIIRFTLPLTDTTELH